MATISAVAYARYSSDKQQESSITVQLAAIRKFCLAHKIELIHEYVDEAQTGTNANRKEFQEMVSAAPEKQFQLIIVHRMDRWARNVDDARYYKKHFAKYGIRMISSIEDFDETPEGEFFELMSMGMAELYSKKLSREATAGLLANAREGKVHGGVPALGYKVKGKYYVIDEKGAEAVRIIFDMTLQGYGYKSIRNYLNANGYRRADGELFKGAFTDLLRNRKYIGEYIFNRTAYRPRGMPYNSHSEREESDVIRIPGGMPRIIDDETFYKVQKILDGRKRIEDMTTIETGIKTNRAKKAYLLSGLIRCGECGRSYCGTKGKSNHVPYTTYRCGRHGIGCPSKAINANYLEDYVKELLGDCLFSKQNEARFVDMLKGVYIKSYDKLTAELCEIEEKIKETEFAISEQSELVATSDNRMLKSIAQSGLAELEKTLAMHQYEARGAQDKIDTFARFDVKAIRQNIKEYRKILSKNDQNDVQSLLNKCIRIIKVSNESVEIVIDSQEFMNAYLPLGISIIEKRDNVARPENHAKRALNFATLSVKVG